jgi:O-antigen ligase
MPQSARLEAKSGFDAPWPVIAVIGLLTLVPVWLKGDYQIAALGTMLILAGATLLLLAARRYEWTKRAAWLIVVLVVWLGLLAANTWGVSQVRLESVGDWWWWVAGVAVVVAMTAWANLKNIERIIGWSIIAAGLVGAIAAVIIYLVNPHGRAGGLFANANALGPFLLWPLWMIWPVVWRRPRRWYWIIGGLIMLAMFLLAVSVTSIAAATPVIGLAVLIWRPRPITKKWWITIGAVIVIIAAAWFGAKPFITKNYLPASHATESFGQRREFVAVAWRMFTVKPLTGLGLQTYQVEFPHYTNQALEQPRYAHNLYAQMLAELGWPMTLMWLAIVVLVGWSGWRMWRSETRPEPKIWRQALWLGWLTVTIAAGLDFGWYYPAVVFPWWIVSGYFLAGAGGNIFTPPNWTRLVCLIAGVGLLIFGLKAAMADLRMIQAQRAAGDGQPERQLPAIESAVKLWPSRDSVLADGQVLVTTNTAETRSAVGELLNKYLPANQHDYTLYQLLAKLDDNSGLKTEALNAYARAYELDPRFHHDLVLEYLQLLVATDKKPQAKQIANEFLQRVSAYPPNVFNLAPFDKIKALAAEL